MRTYSDEKLRAIFRRTKSRCSICGVRLRFNAYAKHWEVDHEIPRSKGGSYDVNNLLPACVSCNRARQDLPLSYARETIGQRKRITRQRRRRQRLCLCLLVLLILFLFLLQGALPLR